MPDPDLIRDAPTTAPDAYIAAVGAILALEQLLAMLEGRWQDPRETHAR